MDYRDLNYTSWSATSIVQTYFPSFRLQVPTMSMSHLVSSGSQTIPIHDIIMASVPESSHASFPNYVPTGYDISDLSTITTYNHVEIHNSTQSPQNSPVSPPDEVYMPSSSSYLRNNGILPQPMVTTTTVPSPSAIEDWSRGDLTSQRLGKFATTILPSPVQIQLAQTFGKDSVNHSFYAEKCFRHILLPLLKSGF